jgi:predicted nucleic acid-binding Zn finger protein
MIITAVGPRRIERTADSERIVRSDEVLSAYTLKQIDATHWLVSHPVDDERKYIVDTDLLECSCMDFLCRMDYEQKLCKHLIAVQRHIRLVGGLINGCPA